MVTEYVLRSLRPSVAGELLLPNDPAYEEARKIHNAMIDRRPPAILRCAATGDVVAAVKFARGNNLPVSIRGAGHNAAGICIADDAILIDLSQMKAIHVDPDTSTARAEPGVTWAELNNLLQRFNLAATGGYVGTTGVAGLTLGGGLGWMVRKHGCALDNLISAEVVTAEGEVLKASSTENPDLFWGIRGGGGNFGIVTSFEFRVHPVGTVLAGLVLHPASKGMEALRFWREYEKTAPEEMTNGALVFTAPPELPVPETLRREPIVGIGGVYAGAVEAGEQLLRPLRQFGPPAADTYQAMPYSAAQIMADWLWPRGLLNYWKSGFLKSPSDGVFETILQFYSTAPSPRTVVVLEHNGDSAFDRVPEDATAFGHRSWPYNFLVTTMWTDPAQTDPNVEWTRKFFSAMKPFLADAGYVNYFSDVGEDAVLTAYGRKYQRLSELKAKYDPTNFFCRNQNIRPTAASAGAA